MIMLWQLVDVGWVVFVVIYLLIYLDVCDQVLLLVFGGKIVFCGLLIQIGLVMGIMNWVDIFSIVVDDLDVVKVCYLVWMGLILLLLLVE